MVRDSTFTHSRGTIPEDGLDIEPGRGETVDNVLITGCVFSNNAGGARERRNLRQRVLDEAKSQ